MTLVLALLGAMTWTPVIDNVLIIASFGAFIWAFGTFSHSDVGAHTITSQAYVCWASAERSASPSGPCSSSSPTSSA